MEEEFKIGDPVRKYYTYLNGYGNTVFFIRRINKTVNPPLAELAQESVPYSHFSYATFDRLKKSAFTEKKSKNLQVYLDELKYLNVLDK